MPLSTHNTENLNIQQLDLEEKTVRDFLNKSFKGCVPRSIFSRQLADYPITLGEIGTNSCQQKVRILTLSRAM